MGPIWKINLRQLSHSIIKSLPPLSLVIVGNAKDPKIVVFFPSELGPGPILLVDLHPLEQQGSPILLDKRLVGDHNHIGNCTGISVSNLVAEVLTEL